MDGVGDGFHPGIISVTNNGDGGDIVKDDSEDDDMTMIVVVVVVVGVYNVAKLHLVVYNKNGS